MTLSYKHRPANEGAVRALSKKDQRRSGFTITEVDIGPYYGFTLDGNGRCLLSNFQVTHNVGAASTLSAYDELVN